MELIELKSGIKEHKYCMRCGRKLKNSEARIKGYGAVCEKKIQTDNRRRLFTMV